MKVTEELQKYDEVNSLFFELEFAEIIYVSSGAEKLDTLDIKVLDGMFENDATANFTIAVLDKYGTQKAPRNDGFVDVRLPRQMDTATKKAVEMITSSVKTVIGIFGSSSFVISLMFAGLLMFLWGLVNTLQMIMLTALYSIVLPLNA